MVSWLSCLRQNVPFTHTCVAACSWPGASRSNLRDIDTTATNCVSCMQCDVSLLGNAAGMRYLECYAMLSMYRCYAWLCRKALQQAASSASPASIGVKLRLEHEVMHLWTVILKVNVSY